ncbi:MAG: hypothetical protein WBB37_08715 [bacterium]
MKVLCTVCILCSLLFSQVLYEEYFTDGNMQLDWHAWFTDTLGIGDSMAVINDPTTPGGDSWAGRISNEYMGVAGLTYSGMANMEHYYIEAWIYTIVTTASGPYNGVAARMNPSTRYYYRLVSDFDNSGRIRLGLVGSGGYPVALRDWASGEIPGGVPTTSSWHKFKLDVSHDSIWCYYDDQELPGCPIINDSVSSGYFGIYTFSMSDTASTKCDNIIVLDVTGIEEQGINTKAVFSVSPNPFRDRLNISCNTEYGGKVRKLSVYDASGRKVKDLLVSIAYSLVPATISWDGKDDRGNSTAPGVYFIVDDHGNTVRNVVKLH